MSQHLTEIRSQLGTTISTAVESASSLSSSSSLEKSDQLAAILAASLVVQMLGPAILELIDHAIDERTHRTESTATDGGNLGGLE